MESSNKENSNKNLLLIIIIICVTLIVIFVIYRFTEPTISGNVIAEENRTCPYECCSNGDYLSKLCPADYECINNLCKPKDSDNDGLTDIGEKQIGTNPNLYDSDGDTLNDYQEVNVLETNPLNINTDRDRYNDNIDSNPTTKDTAEISVNVINKDFNIQWLSLGIAVVGGGIVSPSMIIAKPIVIIDIQNIGSDYSSYLSYDIVVYVAGQELKRVSQNKGKIDKGYTNTKNENFEIKAEDIPSILINSITNRNADWDTRIENIDYEKF